ncbi:peroxisomal membrane anchor protein conserved region-domain-containing protein [Daldinia loculata]|uniref:peroxisomal membrane anchor protein conserved region-domain-containing protein n=1 Tax=Daldinia loculata TaxID=103429 RepID=UPI0020C2C7C8|nr:peroxisomal membrane anchor protein conserved region-domain-containing protein [Daldinia loculata]KAI1649468.1 peroxisomal membrane anchor protein conserved region-domain-containing protein [Daldinia loculata]
MADPKLSKIPAWQHAQYEKEKDAPENSNSQDVDTTEVTLDQARKFLKDETVQNSSIDKKREFLKGKGLDDTQIKQLLDEVEQDAQASNPPTTNESNDEANGKQAAAEESRDAEKIIQAASSSTSNLAPIITYPEFLTTAPKPEPLITPSRLANILTVSGSIWALLYGTARFAINPMIGSLNDARTDYYAHVSEKLGQLVEKLEDTASEVPYHNGKPLKSRLDEGSYADDESTFSDPTELFHRDIGTQTSPVMMNQEFGSSTNSLADKPIDSQARRLTALRASLREISDMHVRHAEGAADLNSLLREVRDEVDKIGLPPMMDFSSIHGGLGYGRSTEPTDEVKKTKDAIRSIKGMFLSSRSFPTTTTR